MCHVVLSHFRCTRRCIKAKNYQSCIVRMGATFIAALQGRKCSKLMPSTAANRACFFGKKIKQVLE